MTERTWQTQNRAKHLQHPAQYGARTWLTRECFAKLHPTRRVPQRGDMTDSLAWSDSNVLLDEDEDEGREEHEFEKSLWISLLPACQQFSHNCDSGSLLASSDAKRTSAAMLYCQPHTVVVELCLINPVHTALTHLRTRDVADTRSAGRNGHLQSS